MQQTVLSPPRERRERCCFARRWQTTQNKQNPDYPLILRKPYPILHYTTAVNTTPFSSWTLGGLGFGLISTLIDTRAAGLN